MSRVVGAGVGLVAACAAIGRVPNLALAPGTFLVLFVLAFGCYALGLRALRGMTGRRGLLVVLLVAGLARLALLPATPTLSTDAYRYVWDARVARAGVSPYAHPPDAPELASLRDAEVYARLNHPTWLTIYPPAAQILFSAVDAAAPGSVGAMKAAMGMAELVGLGALVGLLHALGLPLSRVAVCAWNPLVLVEIWGSGHLDAVVVAMTVAAAWADARGRHLGAGALLGLAAAVKLYPAALLPLLVARGGWPAALAFAGVTLVGYLPAAPLGVAALGSLPRYLAEEYFNPGLARTLLDAPGLTVAVLGAWVLVATLSGRGAPLAQRAMPVIAGSVVLLPNVFPWYAVWLVPFLAVSPSPPWIAFTGSVAFAYAFFLQDPWAVPAWARVIQAAPLVAGGLWWLGRRRRVPALREGAA
jgi:hypothetical protein